MKLFKYISTFENDHWLQPLIDQSLYFSSIEQLRNPNDQMEFVHEWETNSYFFNNFGSDMHKYYEQLLNLTRVLCLSRGLTKKSWNQFCGRDGVCYEFWFDQSKAAQDVHNNHVVYDKTKIHNVPKFLIGHLNDREIVAIVKSEASPSTLELTKLLNWMATDRMNKTARLHITSELAFKKVRKFKPEREFRFVHLTDSAGGPAIITKFKNFKLSFEQ
jgi:hypothetical protein